MEKLFGNVETRLDQFAGCKNEMIRIATKQKVKVTVMLKRFEQKAKQIYSTEIYPGKTEFQTNIAHL